MRLPVAVIVNKVPHITGVRLLFISRKVETFIVIALRED